MEPWLVRAARHHGGRPALTISGGQSYTYEELLERAEGVAGALNRRGITKGDRVALALPSGELVVALHACLLIGAAAVPIDLRLTPAEQAPRADRAKLRLDELPPSEPGPPDGLIGKVDPEAVATVMFTSGTTGAPKEIPLSYANWQWNAIGSALALGLDEAERWLCPMPLAHVGGLSIQLRSVIYGTGVLLHERFEATAVAEQLMSAEEAVTLVSLVPTMLGRLLDAGLEHPPRLRWALLGGGPIAPSLLQRAERAGIRVAPSYGMTEGCSQIATSGRPLFGVELRIAGAEDRDRDTPAGEILVRGGNVSNAAISGDGWLHTGDLGRLDEQGRLQVLGRESDMIITGGENVAPEEVEAVLLEHPAVRDAAVIGAPDPDWGEAVEARVVANGQRVEEQELRRHCAERLAGFKVPKRILVVDELPRGSTGKLVRRQLL